MSFVKRKKSNKGQFIPRFPNKYTGKYPIIVRSSWERLFCQWLDANKKVTAWSSEAIIIPYYDPVQKKKRRYYPDFWMKVENKKYLIEVKPFKETKPPSKRGKKSSKTKLHQEATYLTNQAKFDAAQKYCKKMGYEWKVLTERQLFKKK